MLGPITSFTGEFHFLSNFYPSPTPYLGKVWKTSEHAFQAAKMANDPIKLNIIHDIPSPGMAKRYARMQEKPADWDDSKVQVMRDVLRAKFTHIHHRAAQLIATHPRYLIEGNTWNDVFWGQVWLPDGAWHGENMLGKLLMELRQELIDAA